jgi:tRNA pseudouridine38-40 synthase
MMRNIKLVLEYEGTDFHGFQVQPGLRTVQGVLESALTELFCEGIRLIGAGRTDEGVHAFGQVVNFPTSSRMKCDSIVRALNARLPSDLVVRSGQEVTADFHARFSAKSKIYHYNISLVRSPITKRYAWEVKYDLNMANLKKASRVFKGAHDFKSFCVAKSPVDEKTCVVYSSAWTKKGNLLQYEVEANRFLHNMVRVMVGTMVEVGRGKCSVESVAEMLKARDRRRAGPTAPPHGLFLVEVKY